MSIRKVLFGALLAGAAMAMSSASMAQFDGLYIGGGFTSFKASETADDFPAPGIRGTLGTQKHQGGFNFNAGYGVSLSIVHLAVEASYSNQIGEITLQSGGREFSDSVEQAGAVSILAGFQLGTDALIYARFGAAQAKLKAALSDFSQKHTGKLFGIGMKGAMTPNLALVLEYQNYDLKEKEGVKPDAVGVVVGVQYTF